MFGVAPQRGGGDGPAVSSIRVVNATALQGIVYLLAGTATSLSQSGASITVAGNALDTGTPTNIGGSGTAGTGTSATRSDHAHLGVFSVTVSGNPNQSGTISLLQGTGASLSQSSGSITIGASVVNVALAVATPANITGSGLAGTAASSARSDHVHQGVATISTSGNAPSHGGIMLIPGTGVSVSQSSGSITIGASNANVALAVATPAGVGASPLAGTSASSSRSDHIHQGLLSITGTGASIETSTAGCVTITFTSSVDVNLELLAYMGIFL